MWQDYFWTHVDKDGPVPEHSSELGSCWIWTGAKFRGAYGKVQIGNRKAPKVGYAHRLSWELANGPIVGGLHVLHRCDVPACVRPSHLRLGTALDNARDRAERQRQGPKSAMHVQRAPLPMHPNGKTHCKRGHPLSGENLYVFPNGGKRCRTCHREREHDRYHRSRGHSVG